MPAAAAGELPARGCLLWPDAPHGYGSRTMSGECQGRAQGACAFPTERKVFFTGGVGPRLPQGASGDWGSRCWPVGTQEMLGEHVGRAAVPVSAEVGSVQSQASLQGQPDASFFFPSLSPSELRAKSLWLTGLCVLSMQRGDDLERRDGSRKDRRWHQGRWQVSRSFPMPLRPL